MSEVFEYRYYCFSREVNMPELLYLGLSVEEAQKHHGKMEMNVIPLNHFSVSCKGLYPKNSQETPASYLSSHSANTSNTYPKLSCWTDCCTAKDEEEHE